MRLLVFCGKTTTFAANCKTDMTSEEQKYGAEEPQEWLLFNADHRHERDEQIHFYPDPHVYTFQGQELKPVSTLIAEWFPEFDSEAMAEMKATEACFNFCLEEKFCKQFFKDNIGSFL